MSIDGDIGRTWIQFNTLKPNAADGYEQASNVLLYPCRQLVGRTIREVKEGEYEALPVISKIDQVLVAIGFLLFSPLLIPLTVLGVVLEKCSTTHAQTDNAYRLFCDKLKNPEPPTKPEPSAAAIKIDKEWIDQLERSLLRRDSQDLFELQNAKEDLFNAVINRLKDNPKAINALIHYTYVTSQSFPRMYPAFDNALKHNLTIIDVASHFDILALEYDREIAYLFKHYGTHAKAVDLVRHCSQLTFEKALAYQRLLEAILKNDSAQINPQLIIAAFEELAKIDHKLLNRDQFPQFKKLSLESRIKIFPSVAKLQSWNKPREYIDRLLPEFEKLPTDERTRLAPLFL